MQNPRQQFRPILKRNQLLLTVLILHQGHTALPAHERQCNAKLVRNQDEARPSYRARQNVDLVPVGAYIGSRTALFQHEHRGRRIQPTSCLCKRPVNPLASTRLDLGNGDNAHLGALPYVLPELQAHCVAPAQSSRGHGAAQAAEDRRIGDQFQDASRSSSHRLTMGNLCLPEQPFDLQGLLHRFEPVRAPSIDAWKGILSPMRTSRRGTRARFELSESV